MVWREYPEEIEALFDITEPYYYELLEKKPVPDKVLEAYEKLKKWAWEQGQ